jgi:hypothetical protein
MDFHAGIQGQWRTHWRLPPIHKTPPPARFDLKKNAERIGRPCAIRDVLSVPLVEIIPQGQL